MSSRQSASTAVVLGGTGFIGSAVVRALTSEGCNVTVAGGGSDRLTAERVASLPPAELFVYCAGGSSVGASVADPSGDFEKTVTPFTHVLDRARVANARVVLMSSGAVYGDATEFPTPETAALAPISPYGLHKRMCEQLCTQYGSSDGLRSITLRLFSVYGPGLRKQLLWDACRKARAGTVEFAGTGNEQRDWLHVDDAAALAVCAADHASADAPVINGGSGIGTAVRDVVGQICRELGAGSPEFSGLTRPGDPASFIADVTRARALGWRPQVDLARGISAYVAWFRQQT